MKTYTIRAERKQVGYYSIKAKSLEEAKAQALYQLSVRSTTAFEIEKCEEIELPVEPITVDATQEIQKKKLGLD